MIEGLNKIKEFILDLSAPRRCAGCEKEGKYICEKCELFLSETPSSMENLVTVWEYEGAIEKLIWRIKYDGVFDAVDELVERVFGVMAKDTVRFQSFLEFLLNPCTYITYVPMFKKKEKRRGFNQSELIAIKIGEITNKKVVPLLEKIKDNRSQVGLSPKERIDNVKDVFQWNPAKEPIQSIVLVDDVYTTGATMKECYKKLRENGVKNIWEFAIAQKLTI